MGRNHTRRTALLAAGIGMVLASATAGAQQSSRDRDRERDGVRVDTTFAFASGGSLEIQLPHGSGADVVVRGWARNEMRVEGATDQGSLTVDVSARLVEVGTRGSYGPARVDRLELSVPVGTRLRVSNGGGDITVTGTRGAVDLTSHNGDIEVTDASDRVDVKTFNGDVEITGVTGRVVVGASNGDVRFENVRGDIDVNTLNGDVDFVGVTSSKVRAKTMSGEISYDGTFDPAGQYDFNAFSGGIDLMIARNTGATLTVTTYSGTVDSPDFPLVLKPGARNRESNGKSMTFDLGNGGARISLESFSGEIRIRERRARGGN